MTTHENQEAGGGAPDIARRTIHYLVDGEPQETNERTLTPREILQNAGINPADHYLVEIRGKKRVSYKDRPDEPIHLHEGQQFISVFTGPIPVAHL